MDVILVDTNDNPIGKEEKLKAHKEGLLHRAFSVFIYNSDGEMLLQQRAVKKYHSGGLWSNTCCSHPVSEKMKKEAEDRLESEMGLRCKLQKKGEFIYMAELENGIIEHEYDHIFVGKNDENPIPDPEEAEDYRWVSLEKLEKEIDESPEKFTPWLKIIIKKKLI